MRLNLNIVKAMAEEIQVNTTMAKDTMVADSTQSDEVVAPNSTYASEDTNSHEQATALNLATPQTQAQGDTTNTDENNTVAAQTNEFQDNATPAQATPKAKVKAKVEPKVNSNFDTSELVRATERQILTSEHAGYTFGGTQSFSLRQLWPLKAYNYSLRRRELTGKIVYKNKDAILELGVGSNMTTSIQYWAKAINVLDADSQVTPFAMQLFGTNDHLGLDPYLEKIDSIWLFHYFMCSNPSNFTAAWFLFNRFNHQYFDKALALEELQRFVLDEYNLGHLKQIISANTLEKDIAVVIKSYAQLTHDVGQLRKQVKRLDNNEELSDTPLRELNLMSSTIKETQFNVGSHANLSPYVFAFCLLDFFMRSQGRLVTMDFNKIAYAEGSVGRIFKLDEMALDEYLQQLESITKGTLFFTEQNGLRQLVCPVEHSARLALLKQFLERIYNHAA